MFALVATLALVSLQTVSAWDYSKNGADWGTPANMCAKGGAQSPINLPGTAPNAHKTLNTMFLKYPKLDTALTVYNNGKSIAFTLPDSFKAGFGLGAAGDGPQAFQTEDGEAYRLWQVNFHSPSEHMVNGQRMPLEMQMMHQRVNGKGLAVVVVLFESAPNAYGEFLDVVIGKGVPGKAWQEAVRKPPMEFAKVLGGSPYYTYEGSLTVPPCEQNVKYFVRKEPVPAALSQLSEFSEALKETCAPRGNYRLPQPLVAGAKVELVGAVDLITNPDKRVGPAISKLESEDTSDEEAVAGLAECGPNFLDDNIKNMHRVRAGEQQYLVNAKTKANNAHLQYVAAQNAVGNTERNRKMLQKMYDNAGGPVEKIHVMWKLTAAEELEKQANMAVPRTEKAKEAAEHAVFEAFNQHCADMLAEKRHALEEKRKAEGRAANPPPKKAEPIERLTYAAPNVKLPTDLGGSPFSTKMSDGEGVVLADKISVNLAQPDVPPGAIMENATPDDASPKKNDGSADEMLSLKLPITQDAIGANPASFKEGLIKALARVGQISEKRVEIKEIRKAAVTKVHKSSSVLAGFLQRR